MKVAFKQTKSGGGVDLWTISLCNGIERKGIETRIYSYPSWCEIFPYPLRHMDKHEECDIIHSNTWNGLALKKEDVPLVVTEHQSFVFDPSFSRFRTPTQRIYHRLIFHYIRKSIETADKVICVSNHVKSMISKIYGYYDAVTIYNGVDIELFKPRTIEQEVKGDKLVLLFAGNFTNKKGVELLPKIMNKLGDNFLLLCSSGVRKNVKGSWGKNIQLIGTLTQSQLIDYYNICDIYLYPSRTEGFGLTVAEAMACEKPVVCTNCSALPELVVDGRGGFLCEVDNVNDFVNKIKFLREDENLRKEMGTFNRKRVERKFSLDRMADEYCKVYRGV